MGKSSLKAFIGIFLGSMLVVLATKFLGLIAGTVCGIIIAVLSGIFTVKPLGKLKNALKKAELYGNTMNMSKAGVYYQLTSDFGEKFSKEAAQYAINNAKIDYKKQALEKAKLYQEQQAMSKNAIFQQLTSDFGEKFTEEEAQYAINNLDK